MSRNMSAGAIDGGLDKSNLSNRITVLTTEPASIADIVTYKLATAAIPGGQFTKSAGTVSGRKSTLAQQNNLPITVDGTATHVAIDDGTDWVVTTCASQALVNGGTVTVPSWAREILAATP